MQYHALLHMKLQVHIYVGCFPQQIMRIRITPFPRDAVIKCYTPTNHNKR